MWECYKQESQCGVNLKQSFKKISLHNRENWGVTKHRNGMERSGLYRNEPEYTETRQNDAGMKRNDQEWYRNVPERAGMTPKYTEMSRNETGMNTNMVGWTMVGKMWCFSFPFFFFFNGGRGGISRTFCQQFCFILEVYCVMTNENKAEHMWANLKTTN